MIRRARARFALVALVALLACVEARAPHEPPLRIGIPSDYPPFAELRDGAFAGLDVDVARRFAADAGRPLALVPFAWPALVDDLVAERFDVAMGGVTMRPERALVGRYTRPVLETRALVLARADVDDVDRPDVRLAVNAGGHLERLARRRFPHAALRPTPDNRALARLLAAGEADAILTDDVEVERLAPALPGVRRLGPFSRDRKAYLGRDPALMDALDGWLRRREDDGTLDALRVRWLGDAQRAGRSAFGSDLLALEAFLDLRVSLMPAVAAAKLRLGRPVEDAAQEARVLDGTRARAAALGLRPDTAEALMRAAIAAARVAQHAWLDAPRDVRAAVEPVDLDREARPALEGITATVLARAADVARDPDALTGVDPTAVAAALEPSLPSDVRTAIARAVVGLRSSTNGGL